MISLRNISFISLTDKFSHIRKTHKKLFEKTTNFQSDCRTTVHVVSHYSIKTNIVRFELVVFIDESIDLRISKGESVETIKNNEYSLNVG